MTRLLVVLASPMLFLPGGCALLKHIAEKTPDPVEIPVAYRAEAADGHPLRRVVVLPFLDLTGHGEKAQEVERAFTVALNKRQRFEVVPVGGDAFSEQEEQDFFRKGVVNHETLLRMADRHQADAVLYGVITRYRAYEPIALGVRVELVSAGAGDVVWSANGIFDANDARVVQDVHNYHNTVLASSTSLEGWRRLLVSPARFTTYACERMVETF